MVLRQEIVREVQYFLIEVLDLKMQELETKEALRKAMFRELIALDGDQWLLRQPLAIPRKRGKLKQQLKALNEVIDRVKIECFDLGKALTLLKQGEPDSVLEYLEALAQTAKAFGEPDATNKALWLHLGLMLFSRRASH